MSWMVIMLAVGVGSIAFTTAVHRSSEPDPGLDAREKSGPLGRALGVGHMVGTVVPFLGVRCPATR
jgi:hypothetical protein